VVGAFTSWVHGRRDGRGSVLTPVLFAWTGVRGLANPQAPLGTNRQRMVVGTVLRRLLSYARGSGAPAKPPFLAAMHLPGAVAGRRVPAGRQADGANLPRGPAFVELR